MNVEAGDTIGMRITIRNLPDCYYKERFVEMVNDLDAKIWVVASIGYDNDYAVYVGHPPFDAWKSEYRQEMSFYLDRSELDGTIASGDKLTKDTAEQLFPQFKKLRYRL